MRQFRSTVFVSAVALGSVVHAQGPTLIGGRDFNLSSASLGGGTELVGAASNTANGLTANTPWGNSGDGISYRFNSPSDFRYDFVSPVTIDGNFYLYNGWDFQDQAIRNFSLSFLDSAGSLIGSPFQGVGSPGINNEVFGLPQAYAGVKTANLRVESSHTPHVEFREVAFDGGGETSLLFRELRSEGEVAFFRDEVPFGFDHVGLGFQGRVYESHPPQGDVVLAGETYGVVEDDWLDADSPSGRVRVPLDDGVQWGHTVGSFQTHRHLSDQAPQDNVPVIDFKDVPIDSSLARRMVERIELRADSRFRYLGEELPEMKDNLAPHLQKGGGGFNEFTCVGLMEWSAEAAGHNNGQGFIPNGMEEIPGVFPMLSPQLLYWAALSENAFQNAKDWVSGFLDPVDFILTDPRGRRFGFTSTDGNLSEIPNAFFSGDAAEEQFIILDPIAGKYTLELFGLGEDAFAALGNSINGTSISQFLASGERTVLSIVIVPEPNSVSILLCGGAGAAFMFRRSQRLHAGSQTSKVAAPHPRPSRC